MEEATDNPIAEVLMPHVHSLDSAEVSFVVIVDGREWQVVVPLRRVQLIFHQEAARVGCPLPRSIGSARTLGGWFSGVSKAWKKATRKIKRALPKVARRAISRVEKTANWGAKAAWDAHLVAKKVVTSRPFAYALTAAAVAVPALAPAAGAVHAARAIMKNIEAGHQAAKALASGIKSPSVNKALQTAWATRGASQQIINKARANNPQAMQIMGALRQMNPAAPRRPPLPWLFGRR